MSNLNDSILVNPSDEHIKALLSKLAYENLSTGFNFSNLNSNFSIAEKNYLNENFEVLSVSDSNESGFQGCFLKNTKTNEVIFAIRGTDELKGADADDDLDIINSGMAYKQFIDAYNYYIKTVTAAGDTGKLLKYGNQQPTEGTAYIDTGDGHYIYFEDFTGTGNGYSNVSITGHSLGGHLAALLGVVTGNKATIFNAPGYKDQPKLDFSYVSEDGSAENIISMISGIISKLFEKNINSQGNITHIYNDNCQEWIANYGTKWKNNTPIYCLQKGSSVHTIDEICTAYYAYETIKDITNGAESFKNNSTITSFNETFENVYKAYCLQFNLPYQMLDYSNYTYIQTLTSSIQIWAANQKANGGAIKVDSFNRTTSLPMTGTDGADIIYTGGGNDTVNAGSGNDIVYGINLNGDTEATATSTKTINLGSGNDTYYGSNAKDTVSTTGTNTENDTNHIYLGAGNDNFTGGDGIDIVDGGSGATGGLSDINSGSMTDSENTTNEIHLGGGNDRYTGGIGVDKVWSGSGDDVINTGAGSDKVYTTDGSSEDTNTINLGAGSDTFTGGVGTDIVNGGVSDDVETDENTINLGANDDEYRGGKGKDIVHGGADNDHIWGGDGENKLYGDEGDDHLYGGKDKDIIEGGAGDDYIYGYDGLNELSGGSGNDHIYGGKDKDIIHTGSGENEVWAYDGDDEVYTNDGSTSSDRNEIHLGSGKNKFVGGIGRDFVYNDNAAGESSDISLGGGRDYFRGGAGNDVVHGGAGSDVIYGGNGQNQLYGDAGNDAIEGGVNNDRIYGGTGADTIRAGLGNNIINVGKDLDHDYVYIYNNAGAVDHVYAAKANDTVYVWGTNKVYTQGKDLVVESYRGNKAIIHDRGEDEADPENPEYPKIMDENGNWWMPNEDGVWEPYPYGDPLNWPGLDLEELKDIVEQDKFDPIVVDLNGNGIEMLPANGNYFFDLNGDNIGEEIDWIAPTDGLLMHDSNNNGQVDGIDELFGNATVDGFEELSGFDTNGDGKVNSEDDNFSQIKVWQDINGNNISDAGELKTLEELGINEFVLAGRGQETEVHNSTIQKIGHIVKTDGTTADMADIFFQTNTNSNTWTGDPVDISAEVAAMPYINGMGMLPNLHIASMLDENLKNILGEINGLSLQDANQFLQKTTALIERWCGADTISSDEMAGQLSKKMVTILSKVSGFSTLTNVRLNATAQKLQQLYINFYNSVVQNLLVQTYFSKFDNYTGFLSKDTGAILATPVEDFAALMNEVKQINIENDPLLTYNVFQVINELRKFHPIDNAVFNAGITSWLQDTSMVNMTSGLINDNYKVISGSITDTSDEYSYIIYGTDGTENIVLGNTNNFIETNGGNDYITVGDGNNVISTGAGNDTITAGAGDDVIMAGAGNDTIYGGAGANVYKFEAGFGKDTLNNFDGNDAPEESKNKADIIEFGEGINPADVQMSRDYLDLILTVGNDKLTIYKYFSEAGESSYTVNEIKFADGTVWTYDQIRVMWNAAGDSSKGLILTGDNDNNTLYGSSGSDVIYGKNGNDTIDAGSGNDIVSGGKGNDTISLGAGDDHLFYNLGDGFDTISDYGNNDTIFFGPGIAFSDLKFAYVNGDLRIIIKDNPNQGLLIKNFFSSNLNYKIEEMVFDDGSQYHLSDMGLTLTQDNHGETIGDTPFSDIIYARDGFDTVNAGEGHDIIVGGRGNDYLEGGAGDDTYIYNVGDGLDTIFDYQNSSVESRNDKIKFGENISFEDLTFRREGNNLVITLFNDCTQGIIVKDHFYDDNRRVEFLEFADGTTKNLMEMGFTYQQTDAHDNVTGTNYNDIIYGNGGNDTIYGDNGDDILVGGKGNDYIEGGAGNDTYIWNLGDGFDTFYDYQNSTTESRADKVKFGEGISFDDLTFERSDHHLNIYINGDKTQGVQLYNQFYDDNRRIEYLEFADGTVKNLTEMGFVYTQSDAHDNVSGTNYNDVIYGNGGNDTIYGNKGDDILVGGTGNDHIEGGAGNDTYIWNLGDGFDTFYDYQNSTTESRADKVKFGEGISFDDLTFERSGNHLNIYVKGDRNQGFQFYNQFYDDNHRIEYLEFADGTTKNLTEMGFTYTMSDSNDNVTGTTYNDILIGNGGNDTLSGNNGDDVLYGNDGNDTLNGQNGNDILIGGVGNDSLNGGAGDDTYVYNQGDGFDTISESSGSDKIVFGEGISFDDLTFERQDYHLNVYLNGDKTQGIQLYNQFYDSNRAVEIFEFADGSTVNITQIGLTFNQHDGSETITGTAYDDVIYANGGNDTVNAGNGNDTIYGGTGNDTLNGQSGNDILVGGTGDDHLEGGSGNDTYIYNLGDGFDTISDSSGTDKIKFGEGISFEDLSFENDNNNLTVYVNEDKTLGFKINNYFSGSYGIETLEFADGSTVDLTQIGLTFQQHDGSETITGTNYDDVIYANGGDDTVNAGSGNDTIYGGTGNDTLNGQNGNDTLIGGIGNDTLNGGAGDDAYVYNLGDGYDIITDSSGNDKIKFGEGISFADLKFANGDNNSLLIFLSDDKTEAIQINNFISNGNYRIEQLEFADGTAKNLSEMGLTFDQYDCAETITGTDYDDIIYGNGGNDTLYGGNGNDILSGGTGHDRLEGGSGDDIYVWNLNDGIDTISDYQGTNKIKFGANIAEANLSFAQVGNNLRIIVNNDPSQGLIIESYYSDTRRQIETIEFADGSQASVADLIGNLVSLPDQVIDGTDDDDILTGGNGNDTINAGDGYNDITGGKGNDTLNGGYDKDTYYYNLGDGYDTISDPYGRDKIIFGEGISPSDLILQRDGNDLFISFSNNDNDSIRISRHFYDDDRKIEQLEFADGSIMNLSKGGLILQGTYKGNTIDGTSYNDTIYGGFGGDVINGGAGADVINGGEGDDTINGGVGEDTIIWNLGDDLDTVTFSNIDHLKFGEGITFDDLTFYEEGNNLKIVVKGDMTQGVICNNYFYSNDYKPENIIFADGSVFPIHNSGLVIHHDDKSESISGTDYADTIYAGNGNNNISGGNGNDVIYGGNGDDTISGGYGMDIIAGGKGNDTINGNGDADTYIWNLGDDLDTITASNIDKIQFGEGITEDSLTFRCEGNNLRIIVNNDETQGIILVNFFYDTNYKLNNVQFADGSTLNLAVTGLTFDQHFSRGDTITGTSFDDIINAQNTYSVTINAGDGSDTINAGEGNDTINAGNGNNIIKGSKGNDSLNAGSGDDTYIWNLGDGYDTIYDSNGNDKIVFGTEITPEDLTFTQNGNNLVITMKGDSSQGIEIINYYNSHPLEELHFADGTVKLLPQMDITLVQGNHNETINGTNSNETIYGNGGNDTINGGYGNDVLIGGTGNDTLNGGGDNDTYIYNLGDGLDTISDNAGSNKIVFGEGIAQSNLGFTQIGNNLLIYLNGDKNQGIVINNFFYNDSYKIGEIHFADNSVFYLSETGLTLEQSDRTDNMTINGTDYDDTITGGSGHDTINAGDDDDVLIGGKGNDTLNGGYGRDTYIYNLGDGIDTINETRGNDKIKFGAGITLNDLKFTQEGNDLRITINDDVSQSVLINDFYRGTNYQVETLQFADGATFNLSTQGLTLQQTNADETVKGTSYNDVIYGHGGHDTINAGEGNDTIVGGIGNDILNGGNGDDTYIYNLGDGFDTISESGGNDKIVFGEGISQSDLSFEKIGNNLKISINGDEIKGIQINDHFRYDSSKVETIEFHDGSTLDISNADQLIQAMNSFSLSNSASMDTLSNPTQDVSDMYSLAASQDLTRKAI